MTALQFWNVAAQLRYQLLVNYLLSPESKKPAEASAGFLFLIITSVRVHQGRVSDHVHRQLLVLHRLDVRIQLLQL